MLIHIIRGLKVTVTVFLNSYFAKTKNMHNSKQLIVI